jgi:hypothetical protein
VKAAMRAFVVWTRTVSVWYEQVCVLLVSIGYSWQQLTHASLRYKDGVVRVLFLTFHADLMVRLTRCQHEH